MTETLTQEAQFRALGTTCTVLTTEPAALLPAATIARTETEALNSAASRFLDGSELNAIVALARFGTLTTPISPLLHEYLSAALRVARLTNGLVGPTVGEAVAAVGYDADIDEVRGTRRTAAPATPAPGWEALELSADALHLPKGCSLDLGATAKAHAADRIAAELARRLPGGFLVNLGGDIATSGLAPEGGWHIGVEDADGAQLQSIVTPHAGIATSSTQLRAWETQRGPAHHIVNPVTGEVAEPVWAQVTVVAGSALEANAWSTAAIVLGEDAPTWLRHRGVTARLDRLVGGPVFLNGWPEAEARAA